uniref:Uncharacterized protein n=1 Tax=Arundo donax TaxID=35708 RepID=A0A0A9EF49_ARUDO
MCHRQHNCLHKLLNLFLKTSNIIVILSRLLIHLHRFYPRIIL